MSLEIKTEIKSEGDQLKKLIADAKRLSASIANMRTPDEARAAIAELAMIAGNPEVLASMSAREIVNHCLQDGNASIEVLETAMIAEQMNSKAAAERFAISATRELLAHSFEGRDIWLKGEREFFESIDPKASHAITQFDENGKAILDANGDAAKVAIEGDRLRDSMAIYNGYAHRDKLDAEGRAELNRMLHGNSHDATTADEIRRSNDRLRQAILDVEGKHAHDSHDQGKAQAASKRAQKDISNVNRKEEIEHRHHAAKTDPSIPAPTQEELWEHDQTVHTGLRKGQTERNSERLDKSYRAPHVQVSESTILKPQVYIPSVETPIPAAPAGFPTEEREIYGSQRRRSFRHDPIPEAPAPTLEQTQATMLANAIEKGTRDTFAALEKEAALKDAAPTKGAVAAAPVVPSQVSSELEKIRTANTQVTETTQKEKTNALITTIAASGTPAAPSNELGLIRDLAKGVTETTPREKTELLPELVAPKNDNTKTPAPKNDNIEASIETGDELQLIRDMARNVKAATPEKNPERTIADTSSELELIRKMGLGVTETPTIKTEPVVTMGQPQAKPQTAAPKDTGNELDMIRGTLQSLQPATRPEPETKIPDQRYAMLDTATTTALAMNTGKPGATDKPAILR